MATATVCGVWPAILRRWSTGVYNPTVEISRDTTTLYASDRDVFLFLVDDHNPIEAGRLPGLPVTTPSPGANRCRARLRRAAS